MNRAIRIWVGFTALLILVLANSATQTDAASNASLTVSLYSAGLTCDESRWRIDIDFTAGPPDVGNSDYLGWIVFDANGVPIYAWTGAAQVAGFPTHWYDVFGFGNWLNLPTAGPWTIQLFDLYAAVPGSGNPLDHYNSILSQNAPIIAEQVYDPGGDVPGCAGANTSSCSKTKRYYMYTLRDDDQPSTWQPYCYIVSNNGHPSVQAQARICSVPGADHTYRANHMVYQGWVSTDCQGVASYDFPAWESSWYRSQFAK